MLSPHHSSYHNRAQAQNLEPTRVLDEIATTDDVDPDALASGKVRALATQAEWTAGIVPRFAAVDWTAAGTELGLAAAAGTENIAVVDSGLARWFRSLSRPAAWAGMALDLDKAFLRAEEPILIETFDRFGHWKVHLVTSCMPFRLASLLAFPLCRRPSHSGTSQSPGLPLLPS